MLEDILAQDDAHVDDKVPMAMAMPDRETMLASTPNSFIQMKANQNRQRHDGADDSETPIWAAMTMTTMVVTTPAHTGRRSACRASHKSGRLRFVEGHKG